MSDFFYRFRSASAVLDEFNELENQEIYFPKLGELNDPLEGFKDIFWRGDRIVWRNLFRHYLLCLMQSVTLTAPGYEVSSEVLVNIVHQTDADLPVAPVRDIYAKACDNFFRHEAAEVLLSSLSRPNKSVRRDELIYCLTLIHSSALANILVLFAENGAPLATSTKELSEIASRSLAKLPEVIRSRSFAEDQAEVLSFISNNINQQLSLIRELINPVPADRRSWLWVAQDFPSLYVAALEDLLYPDWHTACFVTDPSSTSMWGNYGGGHRGMCLKFRAKPDSVGRASLDLYRRVSWSGDNTVGCEYRPHAFEPVEYSSDFQEMNFFESLGRVSMQKLSHFWYRSSDGERSQIAARMLDGDPQWRAEYWKQYEASYRRKLPQWSHEGEHRLVVHSNLDSFDTVESRKIKYRFEDLAGLIFGLKTSTQDKIAAMRIIERKCVQTGRTDFEFWQAHYSSDTRKIEITPLRLIKISPGG